MAPLPFDPSTVDGLDMSSLELDRRVSLSAALDPPLDLTSYLSSLTQTEREALNTPPSDPDHPSHLVHKRASSPLSPLQDYSLLRARDPAPTKHHADPGAGSVDPNNINMQGFFALFAILGAAMVLAAIWFFFWAKNGGFVWRKGDWEEYKSTVLRRKGPDGKTLSGATKTTDLGGGSVVGARYRDDDGTMYDTSSQGMSEMSEMPRAEVRESRSKGKARRGNMGAGRAERMATHREERWEGHADDDVRAYRHEKPAKVGGLNRASDAVYTGTEPSSRGAYQPNHREPSSSGFSFTVGSEDAYSESHLQPPHRSQARNSYQQQRQQRSREASPRKQTRTSMPGSFAEPIDFSTEYLGSDAGDSGTKSYYHPIPGLSPMKNDRERERGGAGGFRRGGGRRRDSLSDSEGEDSRM